MALITNDRIRDTTTSTGTGTITVSGTAPITYKTFSQVCSVNDTFLVAIVHQTLDEWEVVYGTYSAANQFTRAATPIRSSDSGNAAISFSAGTKDVFIVWPGMASVDATLDKLVMWDAVAGNWKWADLASMITDTGPTTGDYLLVQQAADSISKVDWALIGPAIGGKLSYVSTTSLQFVPFNGNLIKINGTIYQIPTAGIAGLASATSVFVNGTGATTLASNTLYYVYAFVNSGTVTADFRTDGNGHIMSNTAGNEGVEVRCSAGTTRDDTRTLIGLIHTNTGSIQYVDTAAQRGVRSWLNDDGKVTQASFSVDRTTTSTSDPPNTELNSEIRIQIVLWAGETWVVSYTGEVTSSAADVGVSTAISIDGGTSETNGRSKQALPVAADRYTITGTAVVALSEGFHYATLFGAGDAGTKTWFGASGGNRITNLTGISSRG